MQCLHEITDERNEFAYLSCRRDKLPAAIQSASTMPTFRISVITGVVRALILTAAVVCWINALLNGRSGWLRILPGQKPAPS